MHEGKNALITGGSSGIGKELVIHFAKEGANVIFTGSRDAEHVKDIIKEASSFGKEVTYLQADFMNMEEVENVAYKALGMYKVIDILINNAALFTSSYVLDESLDNIHCNMQVNAYAPFQLIKLLCPKMIENKFGRIINICSVSVIKIQSAFMAYAMSKSKSALLSITKTLASELGTTGVTANLIHPGIIDTPMAQYAIEDKARNTGQDKEKILEGFLVESKIKRLIDPKEVAYLASFLATEKSRSITGAEYIIDGGHLI